MSATVVAYSLTPEAASAPRVPAGAAWDLARLRNAVRGRLTLPNPGASPGCSPVLRELLSQAALPATVDAEVLADGDQLGHEGGNALDLRAPDMAALLDVLVRLHTLFALVAYTDPDGNQTIVWDGQIESFPDPALSNFAARCTTHIHVASDLSRLDIALRDSADPDPQLEAPASFLAPATVRGHTANNGVIGDRVYGRNGTASAATSIPARIGW